MIAIEQLISDFKKNLKHQIKLQKKLYNNIFNKKKIADIDLSDAVIGKNVRLARQFRSISQSKLGEVLEVTFQQIQKYEKGKDRLSALSLYKISKLLNFPLEFFFTPHEEE